MLRRKMLMQALIVVFGQLIMGTTALGDQITMTDAEQQVEAGIGYMFGGVDHRVEEQLVPDPPQGLGNADLNVSFTHYGVSVSESLESLFEENQVTAGGSATASAVWGAQPIGAEDVHGGGDSTFALYFTRGSSPAYFYINGQIDIDMEGYLNLHPEEVFVYVRLSSDDGGGMTTIWEDASDGRYGDTSIPVGYGLWLETGQNYLLEAFAESGTMASPDHPGLKSRTAWFSFTSIISEGEPPELQTSKSDYQPGQTIVVIFSGAPGNDNDWIGLYAEGAGNGNYLDYLYTDGAVNGSVVFSNGLPSPGTYEARLFPNNSYNVAAVSETFTVSGGTVVTTDQDQYNSGDPIVVSFSGAPGNDTDWIGLYAEGAGNGNYKTYLYTGGTTSGSVTFSDGLPTPGDYEVRLFFNNSYNMEATDQFSVLSL